MRSSISSWQVDLEEVQAGATASALCSVFRPFEMIGALRILYVSDFGFDVLSQSLVSGLVECGVRVTDYPYNPILHGEVETWRNPRVKFFLDVKAPKWLPLVRDENDLGLCLGHLTPQGPQFQYTLMPPETPLDESAAVRKLSEGAFDVAVLVVGYLHAREPAVALARLAERAPLPPVVVVDFSKGTDQVRWDLVRAFKAVAVFKNLVSKPDPRIVPLPLSSALSGKGRSFLAKMLGDRFGQDEPKRYDVHYNLSPTWPKRQELSQELDRLCRKHGWTRAPAGPYGENLLGIYHSKIAFSMRGSEPDTLHYWEIPSFQTLMFCDGTMGMLHPHPFVDGETAVFYNPEELNGVESLLERYLGDDEVRVKLATAGQQHGDRHHSNKARAAYFLASVTGSRR